MVTPARTWRIGCPVTTFRSTAPLCSPSSSNGISAAPRRTAPGSHRPSKQALPARLGTGSIGGHPAPSSAEQRSAPCRPTPSFLTPSLPCLPTPSPSPPSQPTTEGRVERGGVVCMTFECRKREAGHGGWQAGRDGGKDLGSLVGIILERLTVERAIHRPCLMNGAKGIVCCPLRVPHLQSNFNNSFYYCAHPLACVSVRRPRHSKV